MSDDADVGVLSGYNARGETWAQTALDFVAPREYWQLVDGQDHQKLVGPRGIGKTTLLRMLVSRGLELWSDDDGLADRARQRIDFCGVLIPARKMWSGQLAALSGELVDEHRARFGLAAFSYMALQALVETAEHRVYGQDAPFSHLHIALERNEEADIAGLISSAFNVPASVGGLRALRRAIGGNVTELTQMLRRAANPDVSDEELESITTSRLLDVDFHSSASYFISLFNDSVNEPERNWVFLVDELEFLTDEAQQEIASALQGQDVRMRFKVSLAPWTQTPMEGMPFNDYTPVELMPLRREQSDDFAERLFARELAKRGISRTPLEVLGHGGFEPDPREQDSYGPSGSNGVAIAELARIDEKFDGWLRRHDLDPMCLPRSAAEQGEFGQVRKVAQRAHLRLAYWRKGSSPGQPAARTIKRAPDLYSGTHSIWAMSEANPRWLKAFAYELMARWNGRGKAPRHVQVAAAERVAGKYLDYFRAIDVGVPSVKADQPRITPYELVERLGFYFRAQVHNPNAFTPDPRISVRVDIRDNWELAVLHSLVFLGGLVQLPDAGGQRRLRLAHMFAPYFRLPLIDGKPATLSRALAEAPVDQLTFPAYDDPTT